MFLVGTECQIMGYCKRGLSALMWHGMEERERDHAPSHMTRNPYVGCQELALQLPDLYSMGCLLYLPKGLIIYQLYLILIEINQIKKIEDSYEIRIYHFKITGFLYCVRIVPI